MARLRDVAPILYGAILLGLVGWFVADFPIYRLALLCGYTLYAVSLWRWPSLWLVVLPTAIPLLDLTPLSGRFFFDTFDALVLLTAGILALRYRSVAKGPALTNVNTFVIALLIASYLASLLLRLWPLPTITADSVCQL